MSVRERKPFVGGNWKMNGSYESIDAIIKFLSEGNLSPNIGHFIQLKKLLLYCIVFCRCRCGSPFSISGSRETEVA